MATGIEALHQRFWARRSPEERLLLLCTRQRLDREHEAEITKLCNNDRLSWETVLATAVVVELVDDQHVGAHRLDDARDGAELGGGLVAKLAR